jgi:CheY-like chemotaxis protein
MPDSPQKILLVDDEPDITYIVEFLLNYNGFTVGKINDSTEALPEIQNTLSSSSI